MEFYVHFQENFFRHLYESFRHHQLYSLRENNFLHVHIAILKFAEICERPFWGDAITIHVRIWNATSILFYFLLSRRV